MYKVLAIGKMASWFIGCCFHSSPALQAEPTQKFKSIHKHTSTSMLNDSSVTVSKMFDIFLDVSESFLFSSSFHQSGRIILSSFNTASKVWSPEILYSKPKPCHNYNEVYINFSMINRKEWLSKSQWKDSGWAEGDSFDTGRSNFSPYSEENICRKSAWGCDDKY